MAQLRPLMLALMLVIGLIHGVARAESGLSARPANATCVAPDRPESASSVMLENLASITEPTALAEDDQGRWFVLNRAGLIKLYDGSAGFGELATAADLSDRVVTQRNGQPAEYGGLGIALDPGFATNGYVYVYYVAQPDGYEARLSRFTTHDGINLDVATESILLALPLTTGVHIGGTVVFGPDGFLYLGIGDGGVTNNAQNPFSLKGKMLRLDVRGGTPYLIPGDNPFADGIDGAPEVYALGFRNPYRFSFDSATGDLWLGDVGGSAYEEVNIVEKGANYGWPIREGAHCRDGEPCDAFGLTDPVFEYPHAPGLNSVIGGFVYHGTAIPGLQGAYVFGDAYSAFYALTPSAGGGFDRQTLLTPGGMYGFAEGSDGEVYVARAANGTIARLAPAGSPSTDDFPQLLSETGCTAPTDATQPAVGLIPYDVISPLWSDGAEKERYLALPDGQQIDINAEDDWNFPVGSVLVKHFRLENQLVETRLFIRHDDGEWGGYSYEWNDAQTDAVLLSGAKNKMIGDVLWRFPSRAECFQCHTAAAGRALGPETAQLNTDLTYPSTGISANQIETLAAIGVLNAAPREAAALPALLDPASAGRIDHRARSYLHANCSFCHRPGGTGLGPADFRYSVADAELGVIGISPTEGDFGVSDAALLYPGDPDKSIMSLRMHASGAGRMPPLATTIVDPTGTSVVDAWISYGLRDTDEDGLTDIAESAIGTDSFNPDTDGDGMPDGYEAGSGLNPLLDDSDADPDGDGVANIDEFLGGTDPMVSDAGCDANGDESIDVTDLVLLVRHLTSAISLGPPAIVRCDRYPVGGDGVLTLEDLIKLQQQLLQ